MKPLLIKELIQATGGKLLQGKLDNTVQSISTDSRNINKDSLFIPLVGEKFDGHDFIELSLQKGALACLTAKPFTVENEKVSIIFVEDTLEALQDLARYYRRLLGVKVIGITGSVGKTSTKDIISSVVNKRYPTLKTQGNFNNEIGLPLTIFKMEPEIEVAVLEMGMNHFGEMHRLSSIAEPDIAVITNIGMAHIENLGSQEGILKAKSEIFDFMGSEGIAILNGDDAYLRTLKDKLEMKKIFYSTTGNGDVNAKDIRSLGEKGMQFTLDMDQKSYEVIVPKPGVHNVLNALAAIAVGKALEIPVEDAIEGILQYESTKMRMDIIATDENVKIINDAYNASPDSMKAALDVLMDLGKEERTIAILGDMLEMGDFAKKAHEDVGAYVAQKKVDILICKGEQGQNLAAGAISFGMQQERVYSFLTNQEAIHFAKDFIKSRDYVLVKGSRGMKMEEIVEALKGGKGNE